MASKTSDAGDLMASTIVKEGWLFKADPSGSNWKNRWCVLIPTAFFYYVEHDKRDTNLKGSFELAEAKLGVGWKLSKKLNTDKKFVFHLSLPGRTYYFAAATQAHMNDWVAKLERTLAQLQQRAADDAFVGLEAEEDEYADADSAYASVPRRRTGRGMPAIAEAPEDNQTSASNDEEALVAAAGSLPSGLRGATSPYSRQQGKAYPLKTALAARYNAVLKTATLGEDGSGSTDGAAQGHPSSASLDSGADSTSFVVLAGGPESNMGPRFTTEHKFTIVCRNNKRNTLSIGQIKKKLCKSTGFDPSSLKITFDGDNFELDDELTAQDVELGPEVPLRLSLREGSSTAQDREEQQEEAVQAEAALPPAPAASQPSRVELLPLAPAREKAASLPTIDEHEGEYAERRVARQLTSADDGEAQAAGVKAASLHQAAPNSRVAARTDKRNQLLQIFGAAAHSESPGLIRADPTAVSRLVRVHTTDFAGALAADSTVLSWPEYDDIINRLISPTMPPTVSWEEISVMFREIQSSNDFAVHAEQVIQAAEAARAEDAALSAAAVQHAAQPAASSPPVTIVQPVAPLQAKAPSQSGGAGLPAIRSPTVPERKRSSAVESTANRGSPGKAGPENVVVVPRAASKAPNKRHVMVMSVDVPNGVSEDINVSVGTDAEQLAQSFIAKHNLNAAQFHSALVNEIRKVLVDVYALELADATAAAAGSEHGKSRSSSQGASASAAEIADLKAHNVALEARLQAVNADCASLQERLQASQRENDAFKHDAVSSRQQVAEVTEQLDLARAAFEEAKSQLAAAMALNDDLRRKDTWEKHVDGGPGTLNSPGKAGTSFTGSHSLGMAVAAATANLGDWRTWATEKREILARSNADRAALIEENKRLRASLDIRGIEAEARLRSADEDRARLSADANALNTARNRAESELRSVYRQWEEDGRRWATERKQLTDQLESMLAAAMQGSFPSISADKDHSVFSA